MEDIKEYLMAYWEKYPAEKEIDPTLKDIEDFLAFGSYYLNDGILILYVEYNTSVRPAYYFNDMGDLPLGEIKKRLRSHKNFVKSFSKPIYSGGTMKPLFKRSYLFKQETETLWRWL